MTYYVRWCKHCNGVRSWHPFNELLRVMVCDTCRRDESGSDGLAVAERLGRDLEDERRGGTDGKADTA